MEKYPKIIQCDKRGQLVIPKDLRAELSIDEGTGFWVYAISEEGIFLKKVDAPELAAHRNELDRIKEKAEKIGVSKKNIDFSEKRYKKTKKGRLELV